MNFAQLLHPSSLRRLFGARDRTAEDEEDREDIRLIEMAKSDSFRPLKEVLAELEAKERGELHRPVKQSCG